MARSRFGRWWQFRLRTVLLFILCSAAFLGFWRAFVRPFALQRQAIEFFDGKWTRMSPENTLPPWLSWLALVDPQGGDRYQEVIHLDLTNLEFQASHLPHLLSMRKIKTLVVGGERLTAEHLERLASLRNLELLVLDSTSVGLQDIKRVQREMPHTAIRLSQRTKIIELGGVTDAFHYRFTKHLDSPRVYTIVSQVADELNRVRARRLNTNPAFIPYAPHRLYLDLAKDHDWGRSVGYEHFVDVVAVSNDRPRRNRVVDPVIIEQCEDLPYLLRIDLFCEATDQAIRRVLDMPAIEDIHLHWLSVTDARVAALTSIPDRTGLHMDIISTEITDAGLARLGQLPPLEAVDLIGAPISDAGMRLLAHVRVKALNLESTSITGEALRHLSKNRSILELNLAGLEIATGLESLGQMTQLERLSLRNTNVSDAGLYHLHPLKSLRWLNLSDCDLSAGAIRRLDAQLPLNPIVR